MKTNWSATLLLTLLTLASCGSEQFGGTPKTQTTQTDGLKYFQEYGCSDVTIVRPAVDILYVVDNSKSSEYLTTDLKRNIIDTVKYISKDFDYRVVGTPLVHTSTTNYQVLTNSSDLNGIPTDSRRITAPEQFNFFQTTTSGAEQGLTRVHDFMNAHVSDGLFRKGAYHLVVLISNGRDWNVEVNSGFGNNETTLNQMAYDSVKNKLNTLKSASKLDSQQFRMISVTAHDDGPTLCMAGAFSSKKSYLAMSKYLYENSTGTDQNSSATPDSYNLCTGQVSSVFASVNSAIQKVTLNHSYRYWPITFANNNDIVSLEDVQVLKVNNKTKAESLLVKDTAWTYYENPNYASDSSSTVDTRELPTPGEPKSGRHFVRFTDSNLITTPDCVVVKSVSKTEYFGFVPLAQKPKVDTLVLRLRGIMIPKSDTDGWSYLGDTPITQNIKVPHPISGEIGAPVIKTGFMIKLNGSSNYYKTGDSVEAVFIPAGI